MKKLMFALASAAICGAAFADEAAAPEGVENEDTPVIAGEFGLAFDSRYMTYGVIDGKDPIVTPSAQVTFLDWLYFGVESIFDVTKANGKRGGYGNRAGKYTTLDAIVGIAHEFEFDEELTLGVDFNYIYEYIRRYKDEDGADAMDDTQYFNLELTLGGLWLEPTLAIERDLMADNGTYVNLALAHEFALVEGKGEDEDPVLSLTPSIAQGFGNTQRARGYFVKHKGSEEALDHGGLMDTTLQLDLAWNVCENFSLGAYVAYSDYWFDSNMRDGARAHNADWGRSCDHSWNFYGGVSATLSF